jgi:hypothetical protein
MTNNKQTSINWLITQLQKSKDWYRVLNEINFMTSAEIDILEQAREMYQDEIEAAIIKQCAEESTSKAHNKEIHRQQIMETYIAAKMERNLVKKHFAYFLKLDRVKIAAQEYYNKTYKIK